MKQEIVVPEINIVPVAQSDIQYVSNSFYKKEKTQSKQTTELVKLFLNSIPSFPTQK